MRKASRRLTQFYDEAIEPSGLRSTQFTILSELARWTDHPPTIRELAEALVLDRSALGHNLRPLERDALIELWTDANDKRRRYVAMTAEGKAVFKATKPLWQAAQDRFEDFFGKSAALRLRSALLGIAHDERLSSFGD